MTEDSKPTPFSFALAAFDPAKIKRPSRFFALPEPYALRVGQVAMSWSAFERDHDDLLAAVGRARNAELGADLDIKIAFRKRRALLKKEAKQLFAAHPQIWQYLNAILADSDALYRDRNLLVHGKIWIKAVTGEVTDGQIPGTISLVCLGAYRGKRIRGTFTYDDLDALIYQVAHLDGRIHALSTNAEPLPFASPDRSFLQAFLDRDYRSSATSPSETDQP